MPLATRLLLAFVAVALVPLVSVGAFQIASSYSIQRTQVGELQQEAAKSAANTIDAYLAQIEDEMTLTTRELAVQGEESNLATLDALLAYNFGFETLTLLDETGQEVAKTGRYVLYGSKDLVSRSDSDEFLVPMQGERYLGPVSVSQYGEPLVVLALPVRNVLGEVTGVLSAEVNLKDMWDIIARMEIGRGGYAYVVDGEGRLIAHRDSSLVLQRRDLSRLEGVHSALLGRDIEDFYGGLEGSRVIGRHYSLQLAPWFVLVEAPTQQALADSTRAAIMSIVAILVALVVAALLGWYMARIIVQPVQRLQAGAATIGGGELSHRIEIRARDEIGALAGAFNTMAAQLQELIGTLEQRVEERTRGLQAAADVARTTTSVLDLDQLLVQVVDLAQDRFDLYYVGLFLYDEEAGFAVLRAGTGEAGQQMMAQGHKLAVGGDSMIGQCVASGQAHIALDVGETPHHFDNPLLLETRSEMALPLISRGRVIGAMTVQDTRAAAFGEADISVMQTMADQVAVAIDNARLFAEAQAALQEMEATHRRYVAQAWIDYMAAQESTGYEQTETGRMPLSDQVLLDAARVMEERRTLAWSGGSDGEAGPEPAAPVLITPIMVRGQPVGALGFRQAEGEREWTAEEVAMAETISEQLALAADNLRLFEETQRRAARERVARELTDEIRAAVTIEDAVERAIWQLGQVLGAREIVARIGTEAELLSQRGGDGHE
jgi:GAF domain-containing protein/HAMP domain-containing protein